METRQKHNLQKQAILQKTPATREDTIAVLKDELNRMCPPNSDEIDIRITRPTWEVLQGIDPEQTATILKSIRQKS